MYKSNGFVFGGEPVIHLKVESLFFLPNSRMIDSFSNGETRVFDVRTLTGEVFEPLKDERVLKKCVLDHGVPTWCNGEIDCAPEYLYENSKEYVTEYEFEYADIPLVSE